MPSIWKIGMFSLRNLAIAMIMLLSVGLSVEIESDAQWTVAPLIQNHTPNSILTSTNTMDPVLSSFNISVEEPQYVILGNETIQYREYKPLIRFSGLWLVSGKNWTQYTKIHQGEEIKLISYSPFGGTGDLYKINYVNSTISYFG
jgi:hypothetical protein